MAGAKRGLWHDHEGGEGGDLLALIRRERGGSFADTVTWASGFAGLGDAEPWQPHERRERPQHEEPKPGAEEAARVTAAQRIARESVPVTVGSVVDRYLTETRGIPRPASGWPAAIGFHARLKALVLRATTSAGEVAAVQMIYLTDDARKIAAEEAEARSLPGAKQSRGVLAGAVVRLAGEGGALQVAEGPETGLTAWAATGRETWIALGSVAKVEPPPLRRLLAIVDDDPRDAPAAKQVRKAVVTWRSEGREVATVTPWPRRRYDKSDLNDLVQREGIEAVRARIAAALAPKAAATGAVPVEMARLRLVRAVQGFFAAVREHSAEEGEDGPPPIAHGIRVGVGVGKSHAARVEAARLLADLRAAGDDRTVAIAVPTHKLGEEQARAFDALEIAREAGLTAAVWRGREAMDPATPGERMCRDIEAVREVASIGAPIEPTVCRRKGEGMCPFFESCGYQAQKHVEADLWIVPHELLFHEKPAALGTLAALIVDEAAWPDGLEGVDGFPLDLTLDALDPEVTIPGDDLMGVNTQVLQHVHRRMGETLGTLPLGPLRRDVLLAADYGEAEMRTCSRLSWRRRVVPAEIRPGMPADDRRAAVATAQGNRIAMRLGRFFDAVAALLADDGPAASGWVGLVKSETKDGPVRAVRLRGRRKVRKGWQVPSLHLDALLNPVLVRPFWPQLEMVAEIEAATPHMRVRQQVGRDWAKSALVPDVVIRADDAPRDPREVKEAERRIWNSERLRAAVWREARGTGGRVLVVAQKAVRTYWEERGLIPGNVELGHHNAVAGRDEWGPGGGREGVRLLVVIGRTSPRTESVERMAGALTGAAVEHRAAGFRYERQDTAIGLADGTAATTEADVHPDPVAEAIRWQVCEGELLQIIGRGRGVNRTAANPLDVLVLTDRPLPLPVDEAVAWEDLAPSGGDLMLAQGGVALESPTDASACFPGLWPTPSAAKMASQRGRWVTFPIRESPNGECDPPLSRATYRRGGAGTRPASLIFDPRAVPAAELRDWLEDRLGPLARLDVEDPLPPSPPDPPEPRPRPRGEAGPGTRPDRDTPVSPAAPPGAILTALREEEVDEEIILARPHPADRRASGDGPEGLSGTYARVREGDAARAPPHPTAASRRPSVLGSRDGPGGAGGD